MLDAALRTDSGGKTDKEGPAFLGHAGEADS